MCNYRLNDQMRKINKAEELAEAHAEWFSKIIKHIYKDAFIHGYKHGSRGDEDD